MAKFEITIDADTQVAALKEVEAFANAAIAGTLTDYSKIGFLFQLLKSMNYNLTED